MNIKTLMLGWEFSPYISGGHVNQCVCDIERQGMHAAARVNDIYHKVLNVA